MAREHAIEVEGVVVAALPHTLYRVELANGHNVLAHWKSRERRAALILAPGRRVKLEMSPFDLSKGRIIWNENEI